MPIKVLVTGGRGMLGTDLCRLLSAVGYEVLAPTRIDMDITSVTDVEIYMNKHKPDIVVNCAAYTKVDDAEDNKQVCWDTNCSAVVWLGNKCNDLDIPLIHISTDYVFSLPEGSDGMRLTAKEDGKKNPLNFYGLTKSLAEDYIQSVVNKYVIIRTSWLYGLHGNNFVESMLRLANQPCIKVVDDQHGCPTWTFSLAREIELRIRYYLQNRNKLNRIEHVCGRGDTTWYGFAKKIFELTNKKVNLVPCLSEEYKTKAVRPKNSILDIVNSHIPHMNKWEDDLAIYLKLRENK